MTFNNLLFGTAGIPIGTPDRNTLNGVAFVRKLGLDVMELEFVRMINISKQVAPDVKEVAKKNDVTLTCHAPYYINLASGNDKVRGNSARIIREELERGSILGVSGMMFHPGSAKDVGEERGLELVIETIDKAMDGYEGSCQLLIEISAGAGATMGDTFEEVAAMLKGAKRGKEIGVCFDTQHAFASGYDLRTKKAVNETIEQFDKTIGIKRLVMSHLNDSKVELDGHKDRHEHLGDGHIGLKGIEAFVKHPKLQHLDLILETPHDTKIQKDMDYLKGFRTKP